MLNVYREALLQICRDYPGLPDPRTLTLTEIRFFYDGLRPELKKSTGPQQKAKTPKPPTATRARRRGRTRKR